jgi:hypothetical protein
MKILLFVLFTLVCFTLSPKAQAVVPAPDGGYPGRNTAEGQNALLSLTNGGYNTAIGFSSLGSATIASFNTGVGAATLVVNTGDQNTATGAGALLNNTTGVQNTAIGAFALPNSTNSDGNTAVGAEALLNSVFSGDNTAIGAGALANAGFGGANIAIGYHAGFGISTGCCNIDIGSPGVAGEVSTTRIGQVQTRTFIAGIRGVTTGNANAIPVLIDTSGQLGTTSSSRRFKKEITPMDKASEAILALNPVTFQYKSDKNGTPQFGLIAEEVAEVNSDLVVRDENGEIYTVRYDAVNAMLLNEFLKEHRKVEQLEKQIETLTAGLQKVSAHLEVSKTAPQTALNNQ